MSFITENNTGKISTVLNFNNPFDSSFKPIEQWNSAAVQHPLRGKDSILPSKEITCNQPVVVSHWLPNTPAIMFVRELRDQQGRTEELDELVTVVMILYKRLTRFWICNGGIFGIFKKARTINSSLTFTYLGQFKNSVIMTEKGLHKFKSGF